MSDKMSSGWKTAFLQLDIYSAVKQTFLFLIVMSTTRSCREPVIDVEEHSAVCRAAAVGRWMENTNRPDENKAEGVANAEASGEEKAAEPEERVITMDELVAEHTEQTQMELAMLGEAEALLAAQDEKVCTYPEGNKKRQAIYACVTCRKDPNDMAGICYGCSLNCHGDHELVELYTKRNFCCDCGNSKFANKCTLYEEKIPLNKRNAYNHNFLGRYCVCDKPYPLEEGDPDFNVEMVQCVICEDWYHMKHITDAEDRLSLVGGEMICRPCAQKVPFVQFYFENLAKLKVAEASSSKCLLTDWNKPEVYKAVEFPNGQWRKLLCKCNSCEKMYDDLHCEYLLDEEDTMETYEKAAREAAEKAGGNDKEGPEKYDEQIVQHLVDTAGRDQAIDIFEGYNHLKAELGKYFSSLEAGTVVTSSDISAFFDGLKKKRTPRGGK
uniref:UBR-type domain-containing protein n=1 Tax=Steinernema glaseri TaxID=37863 RepID=A0A1I8A5G1_9BILA